MRELWEALCALPHRGSATAMEARAAGLLRGWLEARGHAVRAQPFRAPRSYGWELLAVSLVLGAGGVSGLFWLALLGALAFWAHFRGVWTPWAALFDRHPSQNLLAEAGADGRTLVLMAHYDSAKTWFIYDPRRVRGFRANFLLNAALAFALPPAVLLVPWLGKAVGLYFLAQAALLLWRELTAPYVNGANDNASGVAVAAALFDELARQAPPGWRVVLALTGCEEVGAKGALALARGGEIPAGALILNLDNVGRGTLFYAVGEGMLGYRPYAGELLEAARALPGARPLEYRLAYFDTRAFPKNPCLTLIRLEEGVIPNWHWPSDVAANVRWEDVEQTREYALKLVHSLLGARG
ncbi:Peptidase family M28 [Calidithermus terrae]|uniref:Peptidase family M28 n=1 Tax=Calidithermus terrae TaxID=1408545 RepID=A0A399EEN1_9DEIN|nr:M28 family peptidase [Calidithermus terrae]RIH81450.1 Peptidase family M28 [Calidithermus terrae]